MLEDFTAVFVALGVTVVYSVYRFLRYRLQKPVREATPDKKCGTCKHFDKEEWEAAKRMLPSFAEASRWISPNAMGNPVERDEEGNPVPGVPDGAGPLSLKKNRWECFAVCTEENSPNYAMGLHEEDGCPMWEARDAS